MNRAQKLLAAGAASILVAVPVVSYAADGTLSTFAGSVPGFAGDGEAAARAFSASRKAAAASFCARKST